MFFYKAHGLNILSELAFPELIEKKGDVDVVIRIGNVNPIFEHEIVAKNYCQQYSDAIYCSWDKIVKIKIKNGNEIIIDPASNAKESQIREYILGPAMGSLLHQRGHLVLHASSLQIVGSAIAFLGYSTMGKSTTVTALYKNGQNKGYSIVTDDILAVDVNGHDLPVVYPSFPYTKVSSSSENFLFNNLIGNKLNSVELKKSFLGLSKGFSLDAVPLKKIYILKNDQNSEINDLKPQDALIELIRHSYCNKLFEKSERSKNLIQCMQLVENVEIKILKIERSLKKLNKLAQLLDEDISNGFGLE